MQRNDARWMKGGREEGRHSTDGQLNYTVHFSLNNRVRQTALDVPLQSLAEGGPALSVRLIYFQKEVHPLLYISKPQQWPNLKANPKTIHLKLGHGSTRVKETDTPLDNLYLCNRLALSHSLCICSHSQGAHFVFSSIRIHQQSTLIQNPRKH